MVFSSFTFLFFFLPAFFLSYFLAPTRLKNFVVLVWSCLFYAWGAPKLIFLFLISVAVDYFLALAIAACPLSGGKKKLFLSLSILLNVGALLYFKYANFFVAQVEALLRRCDLGGIHWIPVALPIGISFFTFHKISYIVDVYRGTARPARSFVNYALYIALFPQLIAGPIIRYHDIGSQITERNHSLEDFFEGLCRFCTGLGKKVLIADAMGAVANNVFSLPEVKLTTGYAWLGIVCYAYQIYFDFSGYSDMAIGLGRMMGFRFLENFDQPYIAQSFTEFWRRWHISLSRWMRDYLYIPLGGNRVSPLRMYLNLWLVFLLSGFWHGANWTFVVWGLYHGFFLVLDKLFWLDKSKVLGRLFNTALTFVLVLIGWVLFRSETLGAAGTYLLHMFDFVTYSQTPGHVARAYIIHNQGIVIFVLATLFSFAPAFKRAASTEEPSPSFSSMSLRCAGSLACLLLSAISLSTTTYSPFIYFRF